MSRAAATKLVLILLGLAFFFLLWSLAYEITVGIRWNPALPGEGRARWGLLQVQNAARDLSALTIAPEHFLARIGFPATQVETAIRALIAAGSVISLGIALSIASILMRKPKPYGDAKFGSLLTAEKKRLTTGRGLILGTLNGTTITSDDPAHVLVVGPTRSGKGVSFVIPNGYTWEGSSVWFDPKRENFSPLPPIARSSATRSSSSHRARNIPIAITRSILSGAATAWRRTPWSSPPSLYRRASRRSGGNQRGSFSPR